jgi:hypothetical protein
LISVPAVGALHRHRKRGGNGDAILQERGSVLLTGPMRLAHAMSRHAAGRPFSGSSLDLQLRATQWETECEFFDSEECALESTRPTMI